MNRKDHILPEQLRLYSNLEEKDEELYGGERRRGRTEGGDTKVGREGREGRQGLGNKKTDEIKRQL